MTFRVRPARPDDYPEIYKMAKLTGGGFTNLPPDKGALTSLSFRPDQAFDPIEWTGSIEPPLVDKKDTKSSKKSETSKKSKKSGSNS